MANQVRIIAGKWRSRQLQFPNLPELRPTPGRVRETLFNWLNNKIAGAYCLDLFAGSGALSFEALSRGAAHVIAIDQSPKATQALTSNAKRLAADNLDIHLAAFPQSLRILNNQQFDIVFLDPPFYQGWIAQATQSLLANNLLKPDALVYIEAEKSLDLATLGNKLQQLKHKIAGEVSYNLYHYPC